MFFGLELISATLKKKKNVYTLKRKQKKKHASRFLHLIYIFKNTSVTAYKHFKILILTVDAVNSFNLQRNTNGKGQNKISEVIFCASFLFILTEVRSVTQDSEKTCYCLV